VRELMIASFTDRHVLAFYADELRQMPANSSMADRHLVVKSHHGSRELDTWFRAGESQFF
jgi:hypothetical protein